MHQDSLKPAAIRFTLECLQESCLAVACKSKNTKEVKCTQKQPNCKKRCGPCKKGSMKKVMKSKVATQKWLWWFENGKFFNSNNSGEFWCRFQVGGGNTNSLELLLLKILLLSDHHSHF